VVVTEGAGRPAPDRRLAAAVLAFGLFTQWAQILVFREILTVAHGSELLFGLILAAGLGWASLGAAVGASALRRAARLDAARARSLFALALALHGLVAAGQLLLARMLAAHCAAAVGQTVSFANAAALSLAVTGPGAFWAGAVFALALKVPGTESFGRVYRAESWGAMAGGLSFTFLLAFFSTPLRTVLLGGAALALSAWALLRPLPRTACLVICGLAALGAGLGAVPLEDWTEELRWHALLRDHDLLETRETAYGRVCALGPAGRGRGAVAQLLTQTRALPVEPGEQLILFHNGALAATLEPGPAAGRRGLADLCAALHPAPRRALVLGGTLDAFPSELLRHGVERVDAVELDPALFELARRHAPWFSELPAVNRIAADGRRFVKGLAHEADYDLLIVSPGLPDSAMANRYCTLEFFREAARVLAPDGVLVLLLPTYGASVEYLGEGLARRSAGVWRALREVFPATRAAPVDGHLLAAAKRPGRLDLRPAVLGARLASRPQAQPKISVRVGAATEEMPVPAEEYFAALFGGVLAVQRSLDGPDRQTYIEDLEQALIAGRRRRPPFVAPASLPAPAVPTLLWPRRASLALCAFATGLFGMAAEVALLNCYQNVRGYVYAEIGGIVASFMAGLALGAAWCERCASSGATDRLDSDADWRQTERRLRAVLLAVVAAATLLTLLLPLLTDLLAKPANTTAAAAGFWALVVAAGFLDGATFPALVAWGARRGDQGCGGRIYAWDLAGSALGALFCGAVWIPVFGLSGAMYAVAALLVASWLALWA
jgi:SAM-dependent methyltransferase